MIKILVIEDDKNIADFIQRGLTQKGYATEVAYTGQDGIDKAMKISPALVILDLMLPDTDGLNICRQLHSVGNPSVIMLTARTMLGDRVLGLEVGADDYITKPFEFEELVARIKAVLRRKSPLLQETIRVSDIEIDVWRRQVRRGSRIIDLTTREFDLLKLLAENVGRPLRRETILEHIWGEDYESDTDPVKVYISLIRRKLNVEGEPDLIEALRGFGYVLKEKP